MNIKNGNLEISLENWAQIGEKAGWMTDQIRAEAGWFDSPEAKEVYRERRNNKKKWMAAIKNAGNAELAIDRLIDQTRNSLQQIKHYTEALANVDGQFTDLTYQLPMLGAEFEKELHSLQEELQVAKQHVKSQDMDSYQPLPGWEGHNKSLTDLQETTQETTQEIQNPSETEAVQEGEGGIPQQELIDAAERADQGQELATPDIGSEESLEQYQQKLENQQNNLHSVDKPQSNIVEFQNMQEVIDYVIKTAKENSISLEQMKAIASLANNEKLDPKSKKFWNLLKSIQTEMQKQGLKPRDFWSRIQHSVDKGKYAAHNKDLTLS